MFSGYSLDTYPFEILILHLILNLHVLQLPIFLSMIIWDLSDFSLNASLDVGRLCCSQPYPLVCECKAGKSIPDNATEELFRIAKRHLKENYDQAMRLIIGPSEPTKNLKESAQISKISIIKTMTLQKLVELKAKYPGAINLIELKQYLEPGQIDDKINEYIDKIEKEIKLRSYIIQLVKNYLQNSGIESAGVDALHGAYFGSNPPQPLKPGEMYEILIELSSPLTGYLGRIKSNDRKTDKFYYLRNLPIN